MENLNERVLEVMTEELGIGVDDGDGVMLLLSASVAPYNGECESHEHWCDEYMDKTITPAYTVRILETYEGLDLADGEMFYLSEDLEVLYMDGDMYASQPSYYGGEIPGGIQWVHSLSGSTVIK